MYKPTISQVQARIGQLWRPPRAGIRIMIVGDSGSGKSMMIRTVFESLWRHDRVLWLDLKADDDPSDAFGTPLPALAHGIGGADAHVRLSVSPETDRDDAKQTVGDALRLVREEGQWIVVCPELAALTGTGRSSLGLGNELEALLYRGRSADVSVIMAAQSTVGLHSAARRQQTAMIIGANSRRDRPELREQAGLDKKEFDPVLDSLRPGQWLWTDRGAGDYKGIFETWDGIPE